MIHKERTLDSPDLPSETLWSDGYAYIGTPGSPIAPVSVTTTGVTVPTFGNLEVIDYSCGKGRWNPCYHRRGKISLLDPRITLKIYPHTSYYRWWNNFPLHQGSRDGTGTRLVSAFNKGLKSFDQDELDTMAISSVWPQVEQGAGESAANFAIDLPKLASLRSSGSRFLQSFNRVKRIISDTASTRWKLRRMASLRTIKEVLRSVSEGTLINQYVLKTTYDDLHTFWYAAREVRDQLELLKRRAGKLQKRKYMRVLAPEGIDGLATDAFSTAWSYPYTSPTGSNGYYNSECYTQYVRARHNLHISYSYELPDLSDKLLLVGGMLDYLGLNLNPRIIWDATRYSFVVDWVLRVGEFLDQFKVPVLSPVVVVHSCWSTLHVHQRTSCYGWKTATTKVSDPSTACPKTLVGTAEDELFVRRRATKGFLGLKTSGLSTYEVTMLASLFGARLR